MAEKKYLDYDGLLYYHGKVANALDKKVNKETGKSLMSTEEHTKLEGIETGAQANKIETISVNGTDKAITNKKVEISVPTKLSQLENDGSYVVDTNYVHTDVNFTQEEKEKLATIAANANKYELPTASTTVLGGVKVGTGLGVAEDGKLYVTGDATVNSVEWGVVQNTPTTISGYGITDASIVGQVVTLGENSITVPTTVAQLTDAGDYLKEEAEFKASAAASITTENITAWSGKQDKLTAGTNITIAADGTISAKDTTYTAGTGIDITNGIISNTQTSAEWGNITGTLSTQTDLQDALNDKQGKLTASTGINIDTNNNISVKTDVIQKKITAGDGLKFDETDDSKLSVDTSKIMESFTLASDSGLKWAEGTDKKLDVDTTVIATKSSVDNLATDLSTNYVTNTTFNSTNVSKFNNDAKYQTETQVTDAIADAVGQITSFEYSVVEELPETGVKGTIYLIANSGEAKNIYDEYLYINNAFEKIGTTATDLSGYVKESDLKAITNQEIDTIWNTYDDTLTKEY